MTQPDIDRGLPRRQVLLTGGVVVAAAAVTAACSSGSAGAPSTSPTASATSSGTSSPTASASSPGPTPESSQDSSTPSGTVVPVSQVPVGGGVVLQSAPVVVTQPTAGVFKAFSAVCTHQGCTVGGVQGGVIVCPCHNSTFSITDGSVQGGPAPAALPSVGVTVSGSNVVVAS
jgi:Rieske Fe-S protein